MTCQPGRTADHQMLAMTDPASVARIVLGRCGTPGRCFGGVDHRHSTVPASPESGAGYLLFGLLVLARTS